MTLSKDAKAVAVHLVVDRYKEDNTKSRDSKKGSGVKANQ